VKLTVDMPWEKDLSVNSYRFGKPSPKAKGKWKKRRVRKPHVQAWMEELAWYVTLWLQIVPSWRGLTKKGFDIPIYVKVEFYFPDKRRRDDHNLHYVIANAVAAGLGIDDQHIRISTRSVTVDGKNPGFTIEVSDER